MIKILIVEDSPVMQQLLIFTISSDPDFKIVGVARNGVEAIEAVTKLKPDVIAMDFQMPKLNGIEATKTIMATNPTPIVIVTGSLTTKDQVLSFNLMEAGALAIIKKPPSVAHPEYKNEAKKLIKTLKLMSEIKLVKRYSKSTREQKDAIPLIEKSIDEDTKIQLVVMGASTGGPIVLQQILLGLPKDFPVPILIVQHISPGFTKGYVEWLKNTTHFPFHIASQGEYLLPGHVYVAPDDFHMGVEKGLRIALSQNNAENGLRPSVSYLFRTAAQNFGARAVGILLSGMGRDGGEELKLLKDKGAVTFAQNKESSVVHGMPGEAIKLGAVSHIMSPEEITVALSSLIKKMNFKK
ncbi:MAG: chemotaxis-specific protein-glutamate methyltransferase CheB [Bacteroidetes bacterium]|nr:chemotaxis-specific protein-glutamate methyltransferase CheB [Bacteroidota bacterium]